MSYWNTNIPAGTFGNFDLAGKYSFPKPDQLNLPAFNTDIPAGTFGSFPSIDGSVAGQAAFGSAPSAGGLGSWGGMQAVGGIANTLLNQLGNAQGTQAGQDFLDYMADKEDAKWGSALYERNLDIADQLRIPRTIAKLRVNDPNLRQEARAFGLTPASIGQYGQLAGFLA
jgi:hypothetical protein